MSVIDPEYAAARSVLLDALDALGAQAGAVILVGAQAVYVHTGDVPETGINRTTDSDLAINTELLEADPELTSTLEAAGFVNKDSNLPGSWTGAHGVKVDIMTVPHQSNQTKARSRSPRLPPHGQQLARITPGLEPALVDNAQHTILALKNSWDELHDVSGSSVIGPVPQLGRGLSGCRSESGGDHPTRRRDPGAKERGRASGDRASHGRGPDCRL
ncbi:hypothetical protein [Lapillicoccus sp.]|uniref:hypothetical protein n=1 Tax=Lapillicoccus sp. TaxID=1909287 RepID=UPI0025EB19FF|nr:hypothetical protein [Lapillicoccus sp.]